MNSSELFGTKKRHLISLQLAPMIDIFTLMIVFLLQSTVIGTTAITFPADLQPPQSKSVESLDYSPKIEIYADRVEFQTLKLTAPIHFFAPGNEAMLVPFKAQIKEYLALQKKGDTNSILNLNLIADRTQTYAIIYSVVKSLKEAGFQSVLLIAEGEAK